MSEELKSVELSPCPFCGEDDIKIAVHKWNNDPKEDDFYSVACCNTDCGRPCKSGFPTRQEAVNSWNTRHNVQDWIKGFLNEVEDVLFSEFCLEGNKAKRALDKIEALLPKPPQEKV